jgi:hypothetical protein
LPTRTGGRSRRSSRGAGTAGLARVELFEDGRHRCTDYLGLYKTDDGWRIVSKLFHGW